MDYALVHARLRLSSNGDHANSQTTWPAHLSLDDDRVSQTDYPDKEMPRKKQILAADQNALHSATNVTQDSRPCEPQKRRVSSTSAASLDIHFLIRVDDAE